MCNSTYCDVTLASISLPSTYLLFVLQALHPLFSFCLSWEKLDIYVTKKPKRRHEDDGIFCSCGQSPGSSSSCGRDLPLWVSISTSYLSLWLMRYWLFLSIENFSMSQEGGRHIYVYYLMTPFIAVLPQI